MASSLSWIRGSRSSLKVRAAFSPTLARSLIHVSTQGARRSSLSVLGVLLFLSPGLALRKEACSSSCRTLAARSRGRIQQEKRAPRGLATMHPPMRTCSSSRKSGHPPVCGHRGRLPHSHRLVLHMAGRWGPKPYWPNPLQWHSPRVESRQCLS